MKFVIRSRILFAKLNDDRDQDMFEASLEGNCPLAYKRNENIKTKIHSHAIQKQMLSFKSSSAQLPIIFVYSVFIFFSSVIFRVIVDSVDLLQSFIKLTACPNDLLRSQGAMLKYLHIISSDLTQVYDAVKLRWVSE